MKSVSIATIRKTVGRCQHKSIRPCDTTTSPIGRSAVHIGYVVVVAAGGHDWGGRLRFADRLLEAGQVILVLELDSLDRWHMQRQKRQRVMGP